MKRFVLMKRIWLHHEAMLRNEFRALRSVIEPLNMSQERQRRVLLLDQADWARWTTFLEDGPLPREPAVPVMLRRLAAATFRLAAVADRQAL
jgi:hypothetical protein